MQDKEKITVPSCKDCKKRLTGHLFCTLSHDNLDALSDDRVENFYKKGQVIFHEGNRGQGLYCIYKGKVKIHKTGDEVKEQIVRFAKEGEVLGYRSLLSNEAYNATATAIEDCVICYLSKSRFLELLGNNNDLAFKTIQLLSKDLKESEVKIVNITQKTVLERVAESILVLKEKFGFIADGKTLDVILNRREFGSLAGLATETTIRALSELKNDGIISLKGKQIEIVDHSRLVRIANVID